MKLILAPNAFKESMSSVEAAVAMENAARGLCFDEIVAIPIGDGGDGTLEALSRLVGGKILHVPVHGPLGEPLTAPLLIWDDGRRAFVEMASASGLAQVPPESRNPMMTTSVGTGELTLRAIELGVREVILGVGGSATVDGGIGALKALGYRLLDENGNDVPPNGAGLLKLRRIIPPNSLPDVRIRVMADVRNPLLGENGAAPVYGPQKGATPEQVEALESGLKKLAELIRELTGTDIGEVEGGGAAGGIAASLYGLLNATIENGGELFLELVGFDEQLEGAQLVLTGEGKIDRQTVFGKGVAAVASHASARGIPVVAFGGIIEDIELLHRIGLTAVFSIVHRPMPMDEAIRDGRALLKQAVREALRLFCATVNRFSKVFEK